MEEDEKPGYDIDGELRAVYKRLQAIEVWLSDDEMAYWEYCLAELAERINRRAKDPANMEWPKF